MFFAIVQEYLKKHRCHRDEQYHRAHNLVDHDTFNWMNLTQTTQTHHFARQLLRKILPLHSCRKLRRSWVETVLNRLWDGKCQFWRKSDVFFLTEEMGCFLKNPWEILKFLSIWSVSHWSSDRKLVTCQAVQDTGIQVKHTEAQLWLCHLCQLRGWWDVPTKKSRRVSNLMGELIYAEFMNFTGHKKGILWGK